MSAVEPTRSAEIARGRWTVRRGERFLPFNSRAWMTEHDYGIHHNILDHAATTLARAIKRGLAMEGSDDFNIAVICDHRVVAVLWMENEIEDWGDLDALTHDLGVHRD